MTISSAFSRVKFEFAYMLNSDMQRRNLRVSRVYFPRFKFLALFPLLLPLAICLRLLLIVMKPFAHIRFGRLWVFNMGNHAMCTENYLCERDAGWHPKRSVDLFYHYIYPDLLRGLVNSETKPANTQLDIMFKRCLKVARPARALDNLNRLIPWGSETFAVDGPPPYDKYGFLERFPTHLKFTEEEEEFGRQEMRGMGMDPDTPFVCFYSRDGVFLHQLYPRIEAVYGGYGVNTYRNSSIENYTQVAEKLTELGYYAIRMGKFVEKPLSISDPKIIDYATHHQSDFMDLYLSARCRFFIGNNGGMVTLPLIFRKPLVIVNVFPPGNGIDNATSKDNIFIPKMIHSSVEGRLLTFRETLETKFAREGIHSEEDWKDFHDQGLTLVENTPEEIEQVSMEMEQRLNSEFTVSEHDQELRARWLEIVREYPKVLQIEPGLDEKLFVGAHFMRTHQDWLD